MKDGLQKLLAEWEKLIKDCYKTGEHDDAIYADGVRHCKQEIERYCVVNEAFLDALYEVRDLIEGYVDVSDGDYGQPVANKAMRAVQIIDIALERR